MVIERVETSQTGSECVFVCYQVQLWQEVLLAVIGEQLSRCVHEDDDICGASLSVRHETNILQIWHLDAAHQHQAKVRCVGED